MEALVNLTGGEAICTCTLKGSMVLVDTDFHALRDNKLLQTLNRYLWSQFFPRQLALDVTIVICRPGVDQSQIKSASVPHNLTNSLYVHT